jgi:hypothetical protein
MILPMVECRLPIELSIEECRLTDCRMPIERINPSMNSSIGTSIGASNDNQSTLGNSSIGTLKSTVQSAIATRQSALAVCDV